MKRTLIFKLIIIIASFSEAQGNLSLSELENVKTYEIHNYSKYQSISELTAQVNSDSIYSLLFHSQSELPANLSKLKNLHSLRFYACEKLNYSEIIDECLKLNHLIDLRISAKSNQEFPLKIYKLIHLKKLVLAGNNFARIPKGLDKLENLEILSLGDQLSGGNQIIHFPEDILKLKNLRVLNLSGNKNIILENAFYLLPQLEELDLSFLTNLDFNKTCESFPNLKKLVITGIEKSNWTGISKLSKLENLSMDYDAHLNSFGEDFIKLENLKTFEVQLKGKLYSQSEINKIALLPNLQSLTVQILGKKEAFLFPLSGFKTLKNLKIDNRTENSLEQMIDVVKNYSNLESLDFTLKWRTLSTQEEKKLAKLSESMLVVGFKNNK